MSVQGRLSSDCIAKSYTEGENIIDITCNRMDSCKLQVLKACERITLLTDKLVGSLPEPAETNAKEPSMYYGIEKIDKKLSELENTIYYLGDVITRLEEVNLV